MRPHPFEGCLTCHRSERLVGRAMNLHVSDPAYTDRLASFFRGLGQSAHVAGPDEIELVVPERGSVGVEARTEVEIYLRVWRVLYPEVAVEFDRVAG